MAVDVNKLHAVLAKAKQIAPSVASVTVVFDDGRVIVLSDAPSVNLSTFSTTESTDPNAVNLEAICIGRRCV